MAIKKIILGMFYTPETIRLYCKEERLRKKLAPKPITITFCSERWTLETVVRGNNKKRLYRHEHWDGFHFIEEDYETYRDIIKYRKDIERDAKRNAGESDYSYHPGVRFVRTYMGEYGEYDL